MYQRETMRQSVGTPCWLRLVKPLESDGSWKGLQGRWEFYRREVKKRKKSEGLSQDHLHPFNEMRGSLKTTSDNYTWLVFSYRIWLN